MQIPQEEVQTTEPTPAFVKGDADKNLQQKALHVNESNVIANAKQSCIPEFEVDRNSTVVQEPKVSETRDNVDRVTENLDKEATEIRSKEEIDGKQWTDLEMPKPETEGLPKDDALKQITNAVLVGTDAVEESNQQDIKLEADLTDKSNKEVQTPECVIEENVGINNTNYVGETDNNPTHHVEEKDGIKDIHNQEEKENLIEEATKTQSMEEEVQTRSHTPSMIQGDTNHILHQETLHVDESDVIDNAKLRCIPEIELDGNVIAVQNTDVSEPKDIVGRISENLHKKDATEIRAKEEIDLTDKSNKEMQTPECIIEENVEINNTNYAEEKDNNPTHYAEEKEGVKDILNQEEKAKLIEEATKTQSMEEEVQTKSHTPAFIQGDTNQILHQETLHVDESDVIDNAKLRCIPEIETDGKALAVQDLDVSEPKDNIGRISENSHKKDATVIRAKEEIDITNKSNKEVQTPECIIKENVEINNTDYDEENVEINNTDYAEEKDNNPTHHAEEREGITDILNQEEKEKLIEEATKTQSMEEEVQTRSHTPAFTQGDTNQILHQETLHVDESDVIDNAKLRCIPEIELDGKAIAVQDTDVSKPKDNVGRISENLHKKDANEIRAKEEIDPIHLTDLEMPKSETNGVPEDKAMQPIDNTVLVRTEPIEESSKQEIQPETDVTDKSNRGVLIQKFVTKETAERNINNYTEEQEKVQTSHAGKKEGTEDDGKLDEKELKGIEENTNTQFLEEEFQTRSPIPVFVQGDTSEILQQETVHIDEIEVLHNTQQSCIPENELDGKSTAIQETNNPETKDNVSTGAENLGNKDAIESREEEGTYVKQLTDEEIPKSETKGVPKDEALQPITNVASVRTDTDDEDGQQEIQPEADVTEPIEINTTCYTEEQEKVPSSHAKDKGIKDKFNQEEEAKRIEEATKIQSREEEVQTRSPTPTFVQGDQNQVPYQETLPVDGKEVINNLKQSCIVEIELNGHSTVVKDTETKDSDNIITKNFDYKEANEIRADEGEYDKHEVERPKPITEDIPEDEVPQPIANAVLVGTETLDDSNQQQIQLEEDSKEKKSSKEEQTQQYVAEETTEINTNSYPDELDEVQTSHAEVEEGIEDNENFDQEGEEKGIEETTNMQFPEEEVTDQILQQELQHIDELEVIDYVKQSCIPEIELDRKYTIIQESEKLETNNAGIVTKNLDTNDASKIREEERTDAKKLTDFKMPQSEFEGVSKDEALKPRANAVFEAVEKGSQQDKRPEADISEKSNKEVQTQEYVTKENVKINITSHAKEKDKHPTSHAKEKEGIKDIFNQEEKAIVIEEATKTQSAEEEVQIRSPTPAFVQGDTNQVLQQETLHVDESEVIDNAKLSCIPEIEYDEMAIVVQKTEKLETKDNFDRVTENLNNEDESQNRAEEGIDANQLTDLEMPKSKMEVIYATIVEINAFNISFCMITGVPEDESLQPISNTVSVENEAVIVSQERQAQEEFTENLNKEVQTPQYFTEEMAKVETMNDTEEQEEVPASHPKEKLGIENDGKFEQEKEKGIEEATKTQLQEEDVKTTFPTPNLVQGDSDQLKSCTYELDGKSTIVEEPETEDNVNIVKQEQVNNQSEKSSIQRDNTNNITAEGLVTSETNRKSSDDVHTHEQETVESCSGENLQNKNAIRVEQATEAKQSTYVEILESETQGEPEDKAWHTISKASSIGSEGLDESSRKERQIEAEFTENFNKDVQTPQCDTNVTAEINITNDTDKQQEVPASHASEKQGIQDDGKFDQGVAKGIEETIETQLPEVEIQNTWPTPTTVQGDIDQMSQQQTVHDDETEAIDNAKTCMTEIELDRKSIVIKEPKLLETKANVDLVKEEQADHQPEESTGQSFITNYIIVERYMTSECNTESSDDVDLNEQKRVESNSVGVLENKDAIEIRAKGTHSKQLTDVELQKSETEGVAEDKALPPMSSATSVNICCQEEMQQEEYAETHTKEVKTPYYEVDVQKQIPEEDTCQLSAENEQILKSQPALSNKETAFIDNLYSDEELAETNPINDIEEEVNPKSHTKEKLVIQDDSKLNEEEAKGIEETKIQLLNTAAESHPEEEIQLKLPAPPTVQGDIDKILQQQTLEDDASNTVHKDMRCIPENELERMFTVVQDSESKTNVDIVEEEQSQGSSMQSLITNNITEEGHLESESNSKLSYDINEQMTVNLQSVEEVRDAKQQPGGEIEKAKNEGLIDFKALQTLTNAALVKNYTLDESNQDEMQPEEELPATYTKDRKTPQSSMEKVIAKHINSEGMVITENSTKSSYDEEEREQVIHSHTTENSKIMDGRKIMLEEASDIKEATDVPVDKDISILSTIPSVRIGIVDESIHEKIQKEVQPAVINTKEEQKPENDFLRNMEVLEAFDLDKVPGKTYVENEEKVQVQSESNSHETIKKHPKLEELGSADISQSSDTKELIKESEVAKIGVVSESVSVDLTEHIYTGKLETEEAEIARLGNIKEDEAGDEFEKISPSSSVGVISRDSQDSATKVLHKKSNSILSGVGSKVKHSISKVKKVITGKSSHPKTPSSSK
ncbi:unnamed protein product [Sphenostylis stenocarpa]|uniref:Uncharacterized protein n=1 Tax=Sphenostylis stenocarpa TaxID=92480 RepID=A0AA86V821_9FABA|nr:unnamed protein product [Sphenostylis stenocarpa]